MRVRKYPAITFAVLGLLSASIALTPAQLPKYKQSDKIVHFFIISLLTGCFYWIFEINRRRNIQLTLAVCTGILGVGFEFIQTWIVTKHSFDFFNIVANVLGSIAGLTLCVWYHKTLVRQRRYQALPTQDAEDVELGTTDAAPEQPAPAQNASDHPRRPED